MPSHLTRLVFRSIIANEPLLYRACRHRAVRPHLVHRHAARAFPQVQRRAFFDLFKQRRKLKPMEMPAGLKTMSELHHAQATGVRPPPPEAVADALKAFFAQRKGAYEAFHVVRAHTALKYLLENPRPDGQPWLAAAPLENIFEQRLLAPVHRPEKGGIEHIRFGRTVLAEIAKQSEASDAKEAAPELTKPSLSSAAHLKLVRLLASFGAAPEARELVASTCQDPSVSEAQLTISHKAWVIVVRGIAQEGDMEEMRKTAALIQRLDIPVTRRMQFDLVSFFAERQQLGEARFWYEHSAVSIKGGTAQEPYGKTVAALLKACARCGDLTFGQEVVTSMLKGNMPGKEQWDAVFLWSAAIGKGVDEVNRMISVMIRRNDEARQKDPSVELIRPDVETINALVEYTISKNDPYMAERYIALGEKLGISPNERTYTMQIKYRLSVNDVDGARAAYFNLQGDFSGAEYSVAVVNELIQALCESRQHHFDEMMVMVDDLHERKASFAPETVAALCLLHLKRGETHDAMDLLQVHAHQYSPEQRKVIQKGLLMFLLDGETSTADAWDTYQILRNVFAETPRDDRIRVMNEFFARKRSDMACHVFFHMRNHASKKHSANREVYLAAFTGFARCADAESLELAHNQLKLDVNVDSDTRLRNSLMLAYASTGQNKKALGFWREICESKEGPSYNSLAIAFRSCEAMPFGQEHARSIWRRLKEQDIEIDKAIWLAYMCAIARNHQHDEAQALIETVEDEYGFPLDLEILGNWFNMTASSERQTHVEAWIKEHYPHIWSEIDALGHWVTMDGFGYRQYNLNRDLEP